MPTHHHREPCNAGTWPRPGEPPAYPGETVTWEHSQAHQLTVRAHPANEFPFEQPDEPHVVAPNHPFNCRIKNLPPGPYIYNVDPCPHLGPSSPKTIIIS
jgi:hypothetical protein